MRVRTTVYLARSVTQPIPPSYEVDGSATSGLGNQRVLLPFTEGASSVMVRRTLPHSTDRVFAAWLDAELLEEWLVPADADATRAGASGRVGGACRLWFSSGDRPARGIEARFLTVEPGRRVVLSWGFCGPERIAGRIYDSLLSVHFERTSADTTAIVLVHEGLASLRVAHPELAGSVASNWELALDRLETVL